MRFLASVRSLYAAVVILFLSIGLGTYVDLKNEQLQLRHLELNTSMERLVRLNQDLTNMLVFALLRQNNLGTASYDTVKADLQLTLDTAVGLGTQLGFAQEMSGLADSLVSMREMEARAINLLGEDKWEETSAILMGDDYVLTRKTYEVDSETVVGMMTRALADATRRFAEVRWLTLGLRVAALLLLLGVGIMFSRRSRSDLTEQMRLRAEITAAYEGMEARVAERTQEVSDALSRLQEQQDALQESEAYNRMLFQDTHRPIVIYDPQKNGFTDCNPAAVKIYGFASRDEILGKSPLDVSAPTQYDGTDSKTAFERMDHSALTHGIREFDWRQQRPNGEIWDSRVYLMAFNYRGQPLLQFTLDDITDRRRNEIESQQRMDELERFNRLTIGREARMIELKLEINRLLVERGEEKKYREVAES